MFHTTPSLRIQLYKWTVPVPFVGKLNAAQRSPMPSECSEIMSLTVHVPERSILFNTGIFPRVLQFKYDILSDLPWAVRSSCAFIRIKSPVNSWIKEVVWIGNKEWDVHRWGHPPILANYISYSRYAYNTKPERMRPAKSLLRTNCTTFLSGKHKVLSVSLTYYKVKDQFSLHFYRLYRSVSSDWHFSVCAINLSVLQ